MDETNAFAAELEEVALQLSSLASQAETALEQPELALSLIDRVLDEYQHLSMAAQMYRIPAIQSLADTLSTQVERFRAALPEAVMELLFNGQLSDWLALSAMVLHEPEESEHLVALHNALTSADWPEAFTPEQISELLLSLRTTARHANLEPEPCYAELEPNLHADLAIGHTTQTSPEHSLTWDSDIHPELLDAYLQETPAQVEHASQFILLIAKNQANTAQRRQAARLAHTIKGASAVLGITPIVQFTHTLEDLLEQDVEVYLSVGLGDTLAQAADMLSQLFDNLLAHKPLPEQYETTLNQLKDWHYRITHAEADTEQTDFNLPPPSGSQLVPDFITLGHLPTDTNTIATSVLDQDSATTHLNVPIETLQQLLNLVGEVITSHTRLQAQLKSSDQNLRQMQQHEERIQTLFDELEASIERQGERSNNDHRSNSISDLQLEQYHNLYGTYGLLAESITDAREMTRQLRHSAREMQEQIQTQKHLQHEISERLLRTQMLPAQTLLSRLQRAVRETCRATGKQATIQLEGGELLIDGDILQTLSAPLLHMVRNAIDHGIELSEQRLMAGKPEQGLLKLSFKQQHGHILLSFSDDGQGFDLTAIHTRALERGLIKSQQTLNEQNIMQLVFLPGFSTRTTVSETSGRGVGMDVVHHAVQQLRGQIQLTSTTGLGSQINIEVPLTLVTTQALIVRTGENWLALPAHSDQQLLMVASQQNLEHEGQWFVKHQDKEIPVYPLGLLLGWGYRPINLTQDHTLLLIHHQQHPCLIQFDETSQPQDIVVKSLATWQGLSSYVHGATILPDGHVAPVLDIGRLLQRQQMQQHKNQSLLSTNQLNVPQQKKQVILIVDDSLSNRKSVAQMVEQMGYIPVTARDGFNGLQLLREQSIDLVLTDLEMPRMNGLEMTQAIRLWVDKQNIPVIMLTSRSTQHHRQLAQESGVNAYLTKPVNYHTLSANIDELLAIASICAS